MCADVLKFLLFVLYASPGPTEVCKMVVCEMVVANTNKPAPPPEL